MTRTMPSTIAKRESVTAKAVALAAKRQLLRAEWAVSECSGNSISSTTSIVRHCLDCCPPLPTQTGRIDMDLLEAKLGRGSALSGLTGQPSPHGNSVDGWPPTPSTA
jgi:hypothetical protein